MQEDLTPARIANSIKMDDSFQGFTCLVEGKKDRKLYQKFFNVENIRIKIAFGHQKVKETLQILDKENYHRKFGIIDRDFSAIFKDVNDFYNFSEFQRLGLFLTDFHDIEVMLVLASSFNDFLTTYCDPKDIEEFQNRSKKDVRDFLLEVATHIGYLKLINKKYSIGLVFKPEQPDGKQLKYSKFICKKTMEYLGDETMVDAVSNYSRNKNVIKKENAEIIEYLENEKKVTYPLEQLVNGHDLSHLLCLILPSVLKSKSSISKDFNEIENSLILAFGFVNFQKTNLYKELKEWSIHINLNLFKY